MYLEPNAKEIARDAQRQRLQRPHVRTRSNSPSGRNFSRPVAPELPAETKPAELEPVLITPTQRLDRILRAGLSANPITPITAPVPPLRSIAFLSEVAEAFCARIPQRHKVSQRKIYQSAFDGSEAVDVLLGIVGTRNRLLAGVLGRSLDAQRVFHEVAYSCRLRDSTNYVYQLSRDIPEVNGIVTLWTNCYSPTCAGDGRCYCVSCPQHSARKGLFRRQVLRHRGSLRIVNPDGDPRPLRVTNG